MAIQTIPVQPQEARRDGEELTAFTLRRIRNEIIEECAAIAEAELLSNGDNWPEDRAYNQAISHAVDAIRALKDI
jgi:hypothetical protein